MRKLMLSMALLAMTAAPALAGSVKFEGGPYQSGVGGEFTFKVLDASGGLDISGYVAGKTSNVTPSSPTFQTFCLEVDEFIQSGTTYGAVLSDTAQQGGKNTNSGDALSIGTAFLYSKFATGSLSNYAYTGAGRKASAAALQEAIWWLEGEQSSYTAGNLFVGLVTSTFADAKVAAGANNYGVKVINMSAANGAVCANGKPGPYCQDALIYVPDGGTTLMLLGGALAGLSVFRRKLVR